MEKQLREFEALLNDAGVSEHGIESFLREHPHFLRGNRYKAVRWQVHLKRPIEGKGILIPDIILEPISPNDRWKIQELKLPSARLIRSTGLNRKGFGSEVLRAMHQLRDYRDYFDNPSYRGQLEELGIHAYKPEVSVIIGRDYGGLSCEEVLKAKGDFENLEVITYTELIEQIRNNLMWMAQAMDEGGDDY